MATIQSSLSSPSAIELADRAQRRIFILSIVFGVIAALIAAVLAWQVWRSNNRYQEAVKTDADARIAEAGSAAATANERAAVANAEAAKANAGLGKSNEEIARLTKEAEQAKTERAEADKQIAIAKADALKAREGIANAEAVSAKAAVEVARLQVIVANAEQRRAEAEKALLELQQRIADRHLTDSQKSTLLAFLKATKIRGKVDLFCAAGAGNEPCNFAAEIADVFRQAGWEIGKPDRGIVIGGDSLLLKVHSAETVPPHAVIFQEALSAIGLSAPAQAEASRPAGSVQLLVNVKR